MKKKFKFTNASIKALPANPKDAKGTDLEVSDTEIVGLKCLSGKNGSKRFLLRYTFQSRKCSIALGRFPEVDVGAARRIASKYKLQLAEGVNPQDAKSSTNKMPTVSEFFWNTYLPVAKQRKKSWDDDVSRFEHHCKSIWNIRYDELKASHVQNVQNEMMATKSKRGNYAPATCNRVLALVKTIGSLAEKLLDIPNVAKKVSMLPENNARTRYCSIEEVQAIIKEARRYHQFTIGAYIAMLFLTGCRASEMRLRKWKDLNLAERTLTIGKTKNGTPHVVYLTDMMLEIICDLPRVSGNAYIFAGTKANKPICEGRYAFETIKKRAGIHKPEEVVFHTARHSFASNMLSHSKETGADIRTVQVLLNHKDLSSTMRYSKISPDKQRDTMNSLDGLLASNT